MTRRWLVNTHAWVTKSLAPSLSILLAGAPLVAQTVSPASVSIPNGVPPGCGRFPVSITLPPSTIHDAVDVFFLFDDTASFEDVAPGVTNIFSDLVSSLERDSPGVSFGFGVGRF